MLQILGISFFKEWHYVIIGVARTPFEGGYYHGENGATMMTPVAHNLCGL